MSTTASLHTPAASEPQVPRRWSPSRLLHSPGLPVIVAVYAVSRLVLFLIPMGLFPYPDGTAIISDVNQYKGWAQVINAGHFPVNDPMWQYPPMAGFVFWLGSHIGLGPVFGFMFLAFACDMAIFIALLLSARSAAARAGDEKPDYIGAWYYVVGGACIGPALLTRFDIFPTLFAVLALLMLAKPVRSGILAGIGALLKIWPILVILSFPRRALPKAAAAMVATGVVGMGLCLMFGPGSLSFLTEQKDRGLQVESVGAVPYVFGQLFTGDIHTVFRYGASEVTSPGTNAIALALTAIGALALLVLVYLRLRGRLESLGGADIALTAVLISIAVSRVFSPQYMIWAVGIAAVCLMSKSSTMKPIAGLVLCIALLGQILYPALYRPMLHADVLGVTVQSGRIVLLVLATAWAFVRIVRAASNKGA